MSQSNLELVRSIYAAGEQGDFSSAKWTHPKIEFVVVGGSDPGSFTGLKEIAQTVRSRLSVWEAARTTAEQYHELDDERVLVFFSIGGRGKSSGLELGQMEAKGASLWHVRDGKVTRLVIYWDRDRALADLGLASDAD